MRIQGRGRGRRGGGARGARDGRSGSGSGGSSRANGWQRTFVGLLGRGRRRGRSRRGRLGGRSRRGRLGGRSRRRGRLGRGRLCFPLRSLLRHQLIERLDMQCCCGTRGDRGAASTRRGRRQWSLRTSSCARRCARDGARRCARSDCSCGRCGRCLGGCTGAAACMAQPLEHGGLRRWRRRGRWLWGRWRLWGR